MLGGPDQQEWLETQGAASGSRGQQAPGGQVTCLGRLRELVLNPRLSTERALMTSTQEDGGERKDSRGGKLRGRVAVEEALTSGRAEAGAGAGAPQEGWGPQAGALLTGSRSRHSGFSWQHAKRTHRWATVVHKAGPRAAPPAGGAWCFLCWGPGWPGTNGSEGPSLTQGLARLLPEPSPSPLLE